MATVEQVDQAALTNEATDDNPSRMLHALCPYCYPETPPIGTATVRWCGQVVTIKDEHEIRAIDAPPDACVLCTELTACSTCGARRTFFGVLPPPGKDP